MNGDEIRERIFAFLCGAAGAAAMLAMTRLFGG